ncbi:MAG: carotenoid biosynthesis protein [Candidatus Villigracilaceae bacterium]
MLPRLSKSFFNNKAAHFSLPKALFWLWVISLIAMPLLPSALTLPWVSVGVALQALTVWAALAQDQGHRSALRLLVLILVFTWLTEWIGSRSGFPFGRYHYTDRLQPQIAGVPLLIPFAWWMMLTPSWVIASHIVPERAQPAGRVLRALIAAAAFTAWDLFLDPQMVSWNLWAWETPGAYFGIPLSNFLGWLLASFFLSLLLIPSNLTTPLLLRVYIFTWLLEFGGQILFWKLGGAALTGFLGMGIFILLAWKRQRNRQNLQDLNGS